MQTSTHRFLSCVAFPLLFAASCGGSAADVADPATEVAEPASVPGPGVRLVSPADGADIQNDPPENLVILDVRTADEFAEGHLEGAVMLDFYRDDFADQVALLDPDVPYLLYCRSGNRSGQTATIMSELGFTDVADVDGGIVAWTEAGLSTTTG